MPNSCNHQLDQKGLPLHFTCERYFFTSSQSAKEGHPLTLTPPTKDMRNK